MTTTITVQPELLQILAQFERNDGYRLDGSVPREWAQAAYNALSALSAGAAFTAKPTKEQAHDMGAKGAPATEDERLLFEEWMRGHCWALSATWDGKGYRSDAEQRGNVDPWAMQTRRIWAAWRDRAALAAPQPAVAAGDINFMRQVVAVAVTMLYETHTADVLRVFGLPELHEISRITDALRPQQVEDIYRRAWDALPPAPSTEGESNG
jgi:hypothetical protein